MFLIEIKIPTSSGSYLIDRPYRQHMMFPKTKENIKYPESVYETKCCIVRHERIIKRLCNYYHRFLFPCFDVETDFNLFEKVM